VDTTQHRGAAEAPGLARGLSDRHVLFIALGGAIGAGFFLGSSLTIQRSGPGMLLAYAASGFVIFLMARALGEMTLNDPAAGSFGTYAERYLGSCAGFLTGWAYWIIWILVGGAEITAVGVMIRYWFPTVAQWIPALAALVLLYGTNMMQVRVFGEMEFWMSLLKVMSILLLIAAGMVMIIFRLGPSHEGAMLSNFWAHGGFFPTGLVGFLSCIPLALFAFGGTELIGLTAAEARNVETTVPHAINGVVFRVLVFYVGSLAMIVALVPWDQLITGQSPFVLAAGRMGLPAAASIVNLIALSAVLSSCNSGIYASARMLRTLAIQRHAPVWSAALTASGRPARAVSASASAMLVGVLMNYLVPERALEYIMQAVTTLLTWVWLTIVVSHLCYRRARSTEPVLFPLPFYPLSNWFVMLFMFSVLGIQLMNKSSRIPVLLALGALSVMATLFKLLGHPHRRA
jgi:AAT family amino acid transporter